MQLNDQQRAQLEMDELADVNADVREWILDNATVNESNGRVHLYEAENVPKDVCEAMGSAEPTSYMSESSWWLIGIVTV